MGLMVFGGSILRKLQALTTKETQPQNLSHKNPGPTKLPKGSIVVPFWDYLIGF